MKLKDLPVNRRGVAEAALKAMHQGKCLSLEYRGEPRKVEVHAVGLSNKNSHPCMRVYQVEGGANFSEPEGWKLMTLDNVDNAQVLDEASNGPRPGYQPGDKGMGAILAEISNEPVPEVHEEG